MVHRATSTLNLSAARYSYASSQLVSVSAARYSYASSQLVGDTPTPRTPRVGNRPTVHAPIDNASAAGTHRDQRLIVESRQPTISSPWHLAKPHSTPPPPPSTPPDLHHTLPPPHPTPPSPTHSTPPQPHPTSQYCLHLWQQHAYHFPFILDEVSLVHLLNPRQR